MLETPKALDTKTKFFLSVTILKDVTIDNPQETQGILVLEKINQLYAKWRFRSKIIISVLY